MPNLWQTYKLWAKKLYQEIKMIYVAYQDRRTPWYAKLLMGMVIAYAVCPIDLIPDFIPVLGLLDDMILVPLGIYWCLKMIPPVVVTESRLKAEQIVLKQSRWFAIVIVCVWLSVICWLILELRDLFQINL